MKTLTKLCRLYKEDQKMAALAITADVVEVMKRTTKLEGGQEE